MNKLEDLLWLILAVLLAVGQFLTTYWGLVLLAGLLVLLYCALELGNISHFLHSYAPYMMQANIGELTKELSAIRHQLEELCRAVDQITGKDPPQT